ncbi:hypothetical protein HAX54_028009 [Datura stramonium]|uniref:Uncharacterized protein n=1 Tax=Datura stramonium TaxID=4076 RepID=A0ABS8V3G6_DATST|nr:hypothetical protein [Datura stramonium]
MGSASKISKHEFIQPGVLAKGQGQSLRVMSSLRVNAKQRTLIVKNNSYNTTTSKLNKLKEKSILVHPCFDAMEDNDPLCKEAGVMQDTQRSDARDRGKNLGVIGSLKVNAEKSTSIGKNRSCTATVFNLNKPAKKSILLPPDFHLMEDNDTLYQEAEVTSDAQRSEI